MSVKLFAVFGTKVEAKLCVRAAGGRIAHMLATGYKAQKVYDGKLHFFQRKLEVLGVRTF